MLWILATAAIAALLYYFYNSLHYWSHRNVTQFSFFFNIKEIVYFLIRKRSFVESMNLCYQKSSGSRYSGIYQISKPLLMIKNPELLKEITVKSFDHFTDHSNIIPEVSEPLWAKNLFTLKGQKWRNMRPILSPSFTSSKMKIIFVLISECAQNFTSHFNKIDKDIVEVELKDSFTRFTNDVIATTAFGIKTDSLANPQNDFYVMGKKLTTFGQGYWNGFKFFVLFMFPKIFDYLRMQIFDKEVTSFFINLIDTTINTRKEKGIVRPDMIHLLIEAQKGLEKEENIVDSSFAAQEESDIGKQVVHQKELTNLDIAAQALIFFFAGFESVSALMCFMGYELACHPDIQTRLRNEIKESLQACNGTLTYETLLKMKYLDMVVSESLRKWPSAVVVDRECTKPYTIQPKLPGETPINLELKSLLQIPIYGIHHDPTIYSDPEKFDPERFNDENKANIDPYSYLPFGLGPRNCIGSRFALLEIKTVFFHLLNNFELVPISKTEIPLKLSRSGFNMTAENGFWFGLKKIKN